MTKGNLYFRAQNKSFLVATSITSFVGAAMAFGMIRDPSYVSSLLGPDNGSGLFLRFAATVFLLFAPLVFTGLFNQLRRKQFIRLVEAGEIEAADNFRRKYWSAGVNDPLGTTYTISGGAYELDWGSFSAHVSPEQFMAIENWERNHREAQ